MAVTQMLKLGTGEIRSRVQRRFTAPPPEVKPLAEELDLDALFGPPLEESSLHPEPPEFAELPDIDEETEVGDLTGPVASKEIFPANLLDVVVGLEHEKRIIRQVVLSENYRFHALMLGRPGSAKSLILDLLRDRVPDTRFVVGSQMRPAGLRDLLLDPAHPRVLLIEELDKADRDVQMALLSAMDGKVTQATAAQDGQREELSLQMHVIAAANDSRASRDSKGLILPLLDRFTVLRLAEYTAAERHRVMVNLLERRTFSHEEAEQIATLVAPASSSIREAERVGELWKEDPELARQHVARLSNHAAA